MFLKNVLRSYHQKLSAVNNAVILNRPGYGHGYFQKFSSKQEIDDISDVFFSNKTPKYDKVAPFLSDTNHLPEYSRNKKVKQIFKHQDVIIDCKRLELNHYKNQKYDKLKPIPLVTKGWSSRKSIGDYFTVKICSEHEYSENAFWDRKHEDFTKLRLSDELIEVLKKNNIHRPTSIQVKSIPVIRSGSNTLMTAETGCGKTLAYLIPIIQQILKWKEILPERSSNTPLALILAPSRDLINQIGSVAIELARFLPFNCNVLVGGKLKQKMLNPGMSNVDLQIATLGAISKLTTTGIYDVSQVKHLILDEADTMLEDSFNEHLLRYLRKIPIRYKQGKNDENSIGAQFTLVSATMPTSLYDIMQDFVEPQSLVPVSSERIHKILPHIAQTFYRVEKTGKPAQLFNILKKAVEEKQPVMIFSNTTKTCDWISFVLNENNIDCMQLNAKMPEIIRRHKFEEFQNSFVQVLSCTDIASRGLDTKKVKYLINYDFPLYMADYVHRCGRVGRIGSPIGSHIYNLICTERELELVHKIEMAVRLQEQLPSVNGNISRIINYKIEKEKEKQSLTNNNR